MNGSPAPVVIVTGGASGLGLSIARRFCADGARVVIADIQGAEVAVAQLVAAGGSAVAVEMDVSVSSSVSNGFKYVLDEFGQVDVLVNNAAIASGISMTPFEDISPDAFMRMLAVNTLGTFLCCQAVASGMRERKHGRIINFSSGTALRGSPFIMPYVASKGAVTAMTRSLAHELGSDGITVNAISPGYTLTDANLANVAYSEQVRPAVIGLRALKRDAYPDDVVGVVAFLASEDARFITGQILAVDGGATYQ